MVVGLEIYQRWKKKQDPVQKTMKHIRHNLHQFKIIGKDVNIQSPSSKREDIKKGSSSPSFSPKLLKRKLVKRMNVNKFWDTPPPEIRGQTKLSRNRCWKWRFSHEKRLKSDKNVLNLIKTGIPWRQWCFWAIEMLITLLVLIFARIYFRTRTKNLIRAY